MASSSSSSAAAAAAPWKYDVFISFRGEDARYTFADHLFKALRAKGIETFMDDQLRRGELISPALLTAIERSRHAIIVLSENYASSKWCLDELVKILQTQNTKQRRAVPIFYHVNPSDVGNQRGSFGKALADHEIKLKADHKKRLKYDMTRVKEWREALTQVGKISGFTSSRDKPETWFIEEIVTDISKDLNYASSTYAKNLVRMDSCVRELESLLCLKSTKVRMLGIWGMGGIGKTTLAKVIYQRLSHQFEGCCFLEGLKSTSVENLKAQLLSMVLRDKNINMGITSIKDRLHSKKVLIVIDDVNHHSILETLVGEYAWFGPQSRIIITTRDKHLLTVQGVDAIYEVQVLEDDNATELFNCYAFKNSPPTSGVMELSHHIISYAQGLPLALKVLGCSLCDRNEDYWIDTLNKLRKIPNGEIQEVLEISFDGLRDDEKQIFLDIACFFRGSDKTFVRKILESCGFFVVSGIENLIDKSLITISDYDRLEMHDLLQEMGWHVVRKASPKEPGKRSRLWEQKDVSHVLRRETGVEEVEGMFLNLSGLEEMRFTRKAFAQMTNLRLLKIYESNLRDCEGKMQCEMHISDDFKFNFDELRYLHWDGYPCESLPSDLGCENLAHFCMPHSHLTQLWEGRKVFENLGFVDVSYSQYLARTPDFSRAINLEVLVLKGCTNLHEIHPSLRYLSKLIRLNLKNCINLEHLPSIRQLVSLKTLILSGCSKLKKLPEVPQHMPYLSELYLDGTAITDLPTCWSELGNVQENSGNLDCISELNSHSSTTRQLPSSSVVLRNSHNACLSPVPGSSYFMSPHCTLTSLKRLNLSRTNIIHLPWNLERLSRLKRLEVTNCPRLQALPVLPSSIQQLYASNCTSLELISPESVLKSFGGFLFGNCFKLRTYLNKMEHDVQSVALHVDPSTWRSTYDKKGVTNVIEIPFTIISPGIEIPDWFRHRNRGHEINIKVPSNWYDNSNFLGLAISAIIAPKHDSHAWFMYCDLDTHDLNSTSHRILTFTGGWTYQLEPTPLESDHVWLAYIPSFFSFLSEKWNHIKFSFSSSHKHVVQSCGICPVYVKGTSYEGDYYDGSALDVTVRAFMSDNQEELDTMNIKPYAQDQEGTSYEGNYYDGSALDVRVRPFMSDNQEELETVNIKPYAQDQEGTSYEGEYYDGSALDVRVRAFMSDDQEELDTVNIKPYAQDQEGKQLNDSTLTTTCTKRRRRSVKLFSMIGTCFRCDNQKPS